AARGARVRILLALALTLALTGAAEPKATLPDIEDEVMCVECRTALNVSTAPVANQERAFIREKIAQGLTKQEIKDALVEAYGPDVLATPEAKGFDLSAWLIPGALVAAFAAAVALLARRWRRTPATQTQDAAELDPDDARRLDAELAAFDK
ncbi:MAG TPA: cytochrome c-type biogenesis protein CcmH, partial [Solirubrobacteraceae bacterium]|nr:cytochrome c-type biogenesis protein CcmH [Solirubrobacteraceae bacterium]